jgi:hypothetical protein
MQVGEGQHDLRHVELHPAFGQPLLRGLVQRLQDLEKAAVGNRSCKKGDNPAHTAKQVRRSYCERSNATKQPSKSSKRPRINQ